MIDYIFDLCVRILMALAHAFGMTYKAVNVWIFCVIWPIFTLLLLVLVVRQRMTIVAMRRRLKACGR